jgi:UrcA family protein
MSKSLLLAVAAIALGTGPAFAEPVVATALAPDTAKIAVSFADLDLTRTAGVDSLYARVRSAARKLCGMNTSRISLEERMETYQCFHDSFARADNDVKIVLAQVRLGATVASLPPIRVSRR